MLTMLAAGFLLGVGLTLVVLGVLAPAPPAPAGRPPMSPERAAAMARVRAHTRGPRFHG